MGASDIWRGIVLSCGELPAYGGVVFLDLG